MSRFRALRGAVLPLAAVFVAAAAPPATAQLMLPGAQPAPPASVPAPPGGAPGVPGQPGAPAPRPQPVAPPKVVGEASVIGKVLAFNGTKGRMAIDRKDKTNLAMTLIAVGEKISKPGEACGVDLGNGRPLDLAPEGRPSGVPRYRLSIPACPMDVDILDGAVLISGDGGLCPLPEADCRVDARGLWGPSPSGLESQLKAIESDRARADRAVRENFKALMGRTPDRKEVKSVAAEQAGFTSERETVCRDYARESVHGFCSARFTELRAAELATRVAARGGPPPPKPQKPRPVAPAAAPGAAPPPPPAEAAPAPAAPRPAPSRSIFDIFR